MAATALTAPLLGLLPRVVDAAKQKHKKKRCKKLRQGCQPGNKDKKCCNANDLTRGTIEGRSGKHCCRRPRRR